MNIKKIANLLLNFTIRRLAEIFGILISLAGGMLLLALITYSPNDPNFIFPENTKIENSMGVGRLDGRRYEFNLAPLSI